MVHAINEINVLYIYDCAAHVEKILARLLNIWSVNISCALPRDIENKVKEELDQLQAALADKNSEQIKKLEEQIEKEKQEKESELR